MDQVLDFLWNIIRWIGSNILPINMILAVLIVFFQRRDPQSVWTWLLALVFLPGVGIFLYFLLGQNMNKRKMFATKEMEDMLSSVIQQQEEGLSDRDYDTIGVSEVAARYSDLIFYNLRTAGAVYTADNKVDIITDGKEKIRVLKEQLAAARSFIHIQYYIIHPDEVMDELFPVLKERAAAGVKIRILYDSMGCRSMKRKHWQQLSDAGIELAEFFPAVLKKIWIRVNYRNHRKIVVIDNRVGFVGGFNLGREYLGMDDYFGYWRDTHLMLRGGSVLGLESRFLMDWDYVKKDNLFANGQYLDVPPDKQPGNVGIQIISSGPDSKYPHIRNNYYRLISKAVHHIYVQTPYFIPDETYLEALKVAAMSGVDVRVMIPDKPDHPFVYWATYSYLEDLLGAGVKCYLYNNGFLHAKALMIDGEAACVGSANMDNRSFTLNFEVNAVLYDRETVERLEACFLADQELCHQMTFYEYSRRPLHIRFKEQVSRLLAPVM